MAQNDLVINNQSFPSFRSDLNSALQAIQTTHSGTSRPTGAVAGQIWLDTTSATSPTLKYYDGADDISLATIDHSANTVNWLDSTVSITGLSTTATGTVLTLSDSSLTSSVNLILQNQKEIRFRETTANGTNYIGLKAPASVTADLTFTLPVAPTVNNQALISSTAGVMAFTPYTFPTSDGTASQVLQTNGSGVLSFATPSGGANTPAFEAKMGSSQTVSSGVATKAQFNTEEFDTASCYDNTTNYRFTPNVAGKYFVYFMLNMQHPSNNNVQDVAGKLYKNGSEVKQFAIGNYASFSFQYVSTAVTAVIDFNGSSDYIEVFGQIYGNATLSINAGGYSVFGAYKLIGV